MGPDHLRVLPQHLGDGVGHRAVAVFDGTAPGLLGARRGQLWLGRDPGVSLQRRTPTDHALGSEKVGSPSVRAWSPVHRSLEEKGLKRYKNKGCLDYWMEHQPATGRPLSTAVCCPLAEPAVIHPGVFS